MRFRTSSLVVVLALAGAGSGVDQASGASPMCCFTNPRYAGVCAVTPAEGETCASVLAYLNDPASQGKSYCASTSVRGGWAERPCDPPKGQSH
jgi:hypothetical protein